MGNRPSSNLNKIKAFCKALRNLESPQQIAERTGYHVVEIDPHQYNKPTIIAEPSGFQDGDDDQLEPFDEYTAYFMSQEDPTLKGYTKLKERAAAEQDRWTMPNYSQFGLGWRGRILHDEAQPRALNSAILRNIHHKALLCSNYRANTATFSYKNEHMLGSTSIAGEPFTSNTDIPEELKNITKLSIDN